MERRRFIKNTSLMLATVAGWQADLLAVPKNFRQEKRVGIIGLDTSHSIAFTKALNGESPNPNLLGYRITAAYPYGSKTIESSAKRIPGYTEEVKGLGVKIVESIEALLGEVDYVMLETNDGTVHLEQAMQVIKAGKPLFIDKPVAASFADVKTIYAAARDAGVPLFSASSLRYMGTVQEAIGGKIGKILGADTYSPATLEPTHPDLFWYGIHGVEMLIALMGPDCVEVSRVHSEGTDVIVGRWSDGRLGSFRGTRTGKHTYGGTAYGEEGDLTLGPYNGYDALITEIVQFFESGKSPVDEKETLAIYAFMDAADQSKQQQGAVVKL
ncbi:Gfo/Idh/MocA family oxidoreductase [Olivibacter sp. SDN3]|uniref:Gfo/Idh/MocA family protein n=1 Tax=Olivibacter sp. SDN3 TaxID=2764720 RepID=UPI001650EAA6|nr:Gfo/Idh/MocA family oxidoreductase [Olivibacter sp. SDN3]QNL51973.1 Gfo/Idh/MocA family oxidoreductase [Olivibacter sp. SDN3]